MENNDLDNLETNMFYYNNFEDKDNIFNGKEEAFFNFETNSHDYNELESHLYLQSEKNYIDFSSNKDISSLKNNLNMSQGKSLFKKENDKFLIAAKPKDYKKYNFIEEVNKSINSYNSKSNSVISVNSNNKIENSSTTATKQEFLSKKKGRPLTDARIIVEENKIITPDDDEYMKARKRIQNRESQMRTRMKKKEKDCSFEKEKEELVQENFKLKAENAHLINDRKFLLEQIKFLQNLISSNMPTLNISKCSSNNSNNDFHIKNSNSIFYQKDIESYKNKNDIPEYKFNSLPLSTNSTNNNSTSTKLTYQTSKLRGLFSVTLVCFLGIICVFVNVDYNEGVSFTGQEGYSLKSETKYVDSSYSLTTRITSFILFIFSFIWMFFMCTNDCKEYWKKKNK